MAKRVKKRPKKKGPAPRRPQAQPKKKKLTKQQWFLYIVGALVILSMSTSLIIVALR